MIRLALLVTTALILTGCGETKKPPAPPAKVEAPVALPPLQLELDQPKETPRETPRPPPASAPVAGPGRRPADRFTRAYDALICRYADEHLPELADGCALLWAQLVQESGLDPEARSPVGACGLGQFMPATWREVSAQLGLAGAPCSDPEASIEAAAFYMAQLRRADRRREYERHKTSAARYNAGPGNIGRAIKACGDPPSWNEIAACLPQITGRHSAETIGYVRAIFDKWLPMSRIGR